MDRQRAADNGAEHIAEVAQLAVDRHSHQREGVGLVGTVEQFVVEFVEALDGGFLMAEDLDNLLTVHHFFDVAVHAAQLTLLVHEELAGTTGEELGAQQHHTHHEQRHHSQGWAEHDHRDQHADHRDAGVDQLGQALADHLAQGIGIVGVDRHDVAVGVGVEVLDGQRLHVGEHLITQIFQRALGDAGHGAVLQEDGQDTDGVENRHTGNGIDQTGKITTLFQQHGGDVAIDQRLHEQGTLHLGKNADEDAAKNADDLELIQVHDVGKNPLEDLAGVFYLGARAAAAAGAHIDYFRLLCHYTSPPFSSKSPEPLVWLL